MSPPCAPSCGMPALIETVRGVGYRLVAAGRVAGRPAPVRTRLLPLLIVLLAGVLLALGFPLAASLAAAEQQRSSSTGSTTPRASPRSPSSSPTPPAGAADERARRILQRRAGALPRPLRHPGRRLLPRRPRHGRRPRRLAACPRTGEGADAFAEALPAAAATTRSRCGPGSGDRLAVASPVIRDGDVVAVVLTDSPTGQMRSRILHGWLLIGAGEAAAMLLAVGAALRLTGWVLRPVRMLDRPRTRSPPAGSSPGSRRPAGRRSCGGWPARSTRWRTTSRTCWSSSAPSSPTPRTSCATRSSALLLRIELLALELPEGNEEIASVQAEGKRLARCWTICSTWRWPSTPRPTRSSPTSRALAAERVAAWRPVAERQGRPAASADRPAATGWADPVALSSALDAVIDNAVKFTPEGERVEVTVAVRTATTSTVEVADGGPGLTDDELDRVGDRFWRSGRHQNIYGSGLGLSIARALLAAGGGTIAYAPQRAARAAGDGDGAEVGSGVLRDGCCGRPRPGPTLPSLHPASTA